MATPTLGNVPSTLNLCNTNNFTGADGTEPDLKKEGANSVAWLARGDGDECYYTVTNIDLSGEHIRLWLNSAVVAYMESYELRVTDGSNTGYWIIAATGEYEGGWKNCIVYGGSAPDRNSGTAPAMTSCDVLGLMFQQSTLPANKINTWTDAWYYGDGYYATGGSSSDEITLATIRAVDVTYAYGIVDVFEGVYFCTGELQVGNGSTTTYFLMDSQVLVFKNLPVNTGLYKLVGAGSGCNIEIVGSVLRAAGTGDNTRFIIDMSDTNIAAFSMTGSFIIRAGACYFITGQTVTGNTFSNCGQIDGGGADLQDCLVTGYEGTSDTSALVWDVNDSGSGKLDGMTFVKGSASTHAIEFGTTSPTTINLTDISFSGYNASNGQTDSAIHIKRTAGTVTVNCSGVSGTVSYKSDGATVVIENSVSVTLTGLVNPTEVRVYTQDGGGENDTLIDGSEDVTTGSFTFSYTASEVVNIVIFSVGYLPADIYDYTIPATAASVPVKQTFDRQYLNP